MGRPWREGADREPSEIGQKTDVKESNFISPPTPCDSHMKTKYKKKQNTEKCCLYFCGLLQTHGHFKVKKNVKNFLDHRNNNNNKE